MSDIPKEKQFLPEQIARCFMTGLYETLKTMSGIEFDLVKTEIVPNKTFLEGEISAGMLLASEKNALLFISAPINGVKTLVSYMTGSEESDLLESDLEDGLAEIINMVAGMAKTQLSEDSCSYRLTSPFVIYGENIKTVIKNNVPRVTILMNNADMYIALNIFYI